MDFSTYLNEALDLEEAGYIAEALFIMNKLIAAFPQQQEMLRLEQAKMKFRNSAEKNALLDFIALYGTTHADELFELILETYYAQNREKLEARYWKNLNLLEKYPHYVNCCIDNNIAVIPIWQDEETIIYADRNTRLFEIVEYKENVYDAPDTAVMLVNELWMDKIINCELHSRISKPFFDKQLPMYLVFEQQYWKIFVYLYDDLNILLEKNRIVFLINKESIYQYFMKDMVVFPQRIYASHKSERITYEQLIDNITSDCLKICQDNIEKNIYYYKMFQNKIYQNIKNKEPRILFIASRFTTVLQYHTRDCQETANRLGCKTELLIEPDGLHRTFARDIISYITRLCPDIIFALDDFRFMHLQVPPEIVWITWAQDPLNDIMDSETPLKLTNRDFVMNHFTTWETFKAVGYSEKVLIDAPIPANHLIYKSYELSQEEKENYACDVCFVCHASDAEQHIQEIISVLPTELHKAIRAIYENYQGYVYETGELFYDEGIFSEYIKESMQRQFGYILPDQALQYLSHDMYQWFNQRVFRQALVDWILDAGFTNIKLWGNGWKNSPKYEKYAMGPAQNGETLSKIYQASKIVIGNNVQTTAAARAWETMLSGGFYMSNYIPPEADVTDIRKIIEVDKDVVMFYNKEDLIQKIHYYLEHEEERQEMISRGRKVALEKMTFDKLMERVLDEVAQRLEE